MKALTLTQPWASLVDNQAKKIETRSWYTAYRGPLVIHAAKGYPGWCKDTAREPEFQRGLNGVDPRSLPLGVGLCVVTLIACVKTSQVYKLKDMGLKLSTDEIHFGDFGEFRWAWALRYEHRLLPPVVAKGSLGLWEWPFPISRGSEHLPSIVCTACDRAGNVTMSKLGCFLCASCADSLERHCEISGESDGSEVPTQMPAHGLSEVDRSEAQDGKILRPGMQAQGSPRNAQER